LSAARLKVAFPPKLAQVLFEPHRYLVVRGGRGSGKSWAIARALLIQAYAAPLRILCTREIQKSIDQSVLRLLSDQVKELGLSAFYQVMATEIRGKNGSLFTFNGLSDQTSDQLKSLEGYQRVWVEEAQSVSKKSWDTLIPTIRADGSEIWISYNPQLESDETHQRFAVQPPPGTVGVVMNYMDNPWFPKVLAQERLHAETTMRVDEYRHIWLGECRPSVEGAIYYDAMSQTIAAGRIREVPHDSALKTHVVFDLGMADSMTLILVQKVASEIRVIHYIEGNQRILADYNAELRSLRLDDQPMNWGSLFLPHDGFHVKHQTGKDDATILRGLGWTVEKVPQTSVNSGIDRLRELFPRIYFHKARTERLVECLKRYRWNISQKTGEAAHPLHDEYSHGADAARYLALVADQLTNEEWGGKLNYPKMGTYA
jgi:phage terminase large subunit